MVDLDHLSADELRATLDQVDSKTPAMRLVVALNHKHGLTQTDIAEQYGLARKTVYNWLTRFEAQPLNEAIADNDRPGRPRKLSSDQQQRLADLLRNLPHEAGYDAENWTPGLVRQLIKDEFRIEYSIPHVRRLMHESGLVPTNSGNWIHETDMSSTAPEGN
jgi:transposase